jgi:hypothetical protein
MRLIQSCATFFVVFAVAAVVSSAGQGQSMRKPEAHAEAIQRWGPAGSVRESQIGASSSWIYEAGLQTTYGFEPLGRGTENWANAFTPLPPTSFYTALSEPSILRFGRIQVGRDLDVNPNPILRIGENADHRAEAEERLSRFIEAVCSTAPDSCDIAGEEFRVRLVK